MMKPDWWALLVSIIALLVSSVFSLYGCSLSERAQMPVLQIYSDDTRHEGLKRFSLVVSNYGLGPAEIRNVRLYEGGSDFASWQSALQAIGIGEACAGHKGLFCLPDRTTDVSKFELREKFWNGALGANQTRTLIDVSTEDSVTGQDRTMQQDNIWRVDTSFASGVTAGGDWARHVFGLAKTNPFYTTHSLDGVHRLDIEICYCSSIVKRCAIVSLREPIPREDNACRPDTKNQFQG